MRIYLDHNATTPVDPLVADAVGEALRHDFGNASSIHAFGQQAKTRLDQARAAVAALVDADPAEIVFTSGGTEADNLAIRGAAEALEPLGRRHLIASAIEHEAVLQTCRALARRAWQVTLLPVDASGIVDPASLDAAITRETAVVSVMHANNEIGTIQPIADLATIAHAHGALFHTDAVQSAGKIAVSTRTLGIDLLALSAHKFNGPKGAGALWIRRGTRLAAHLTGGRQEKNRRAGTENIPAIVGLGVAASQAAARLTTDIPRVAALRDRLERGILAAVTCASVNGDAARRVANTSNIGFEGIEAESLLIALDLEGVAVSTGSACSSGTLEPSHVLKAMGLPLHRTQNAIRFSLGASTTEAEIDRVVAILPGLVERLRHLTQGKATQLTSHCDTRLMRIVVAMSGGVDSSVAAAMLAESGHEVIGVSMQLYDHHDRDASTGAPRFGSCCTLDDLQDARRAASAIGVPHYIMNFERQFSSTVVANFVDEYVNGRTPIPCTHCNSDLKFQTLLDRAVGLEADGLATGHYARVTRDDVSRRYLLRRGVDQSRDQSYFLFGLTQDQLARAHFPIGGLPKTAVRAYARERGLPVADKAESREICFVPDGDYASFVERQHGAAPPPGDIIDTEGRTLGRHRGIHRYTVGQRKGLGVAAAIPLYVVALDRDANRVVVGSRPSIERTTCVVASVNWISGVEPEGPLSVSAQVRYKHAPAPATVTPLGDGRARLAFDAPQAAIAPGQAAVFYEEDVVLGGGWIE